ncbi:MAG: helix-turn-helix domain-containing protein [Lachnospiraceae bacterium]|nr:helix-turn-helix domain-containing protein [Lachnospiraceae bacterium]
MKDTDTIARLKRLRAYSGLTQAEFATKYEIPASTYAKWENGDREPAGYIVSLLERAVEADMSDATDCD